MNTIFLPKSFFRKNEIIKKKNKVSIKNYKIQKKNYLFNFNYQFLYNLKKINDESETDEITLI